MCAYMRVSVCVCKLEVSIKWFSRSLSTLLFESGSHSNETKLASQKTNWMTAVVCVESLGLEFRSFSFLLQALFQHRLFPELVQGRSLFLSPACLSLKW